MEAKFTAAQEVQFSRQVDDKLIVSTSTADFVKAHIVVAVGIVAKVDKVPKMIHFGIPNTELLDEEMPKIVALCNSIVSEILKIQGMGKKVLIYAGDNPQGALLLVGFYKKKLGESSASTVKWLNTMNYTAEDHAWEKKYNNVMVKAHADGDMDAYLLLDSERPKGIFRFASFAKCLHK